MRVSFATWIVAILLLFGAAAVVLTTSDRPPIEAIQRGYRGTAQVEIYNPRTLAGVEARNIVPVAEDKVDPAGQKSSEAYQNVKVLGDVDAAEFLRLMAAITTWVSPVQGCTYCHNANNLADDSLYTKVVARRMIQMTRNINANWKSHVAETGVTCFSCHRGNPVPARIWFTDPGPNHPNGFMWSGKNAPSEVVNYSSLPSDPFTPFLLNSDNIRVESTTALPVADDKTIKNTDWTYALMIHFSQSLGVNCTYCHNSRQFADWAQASPQRVNAWYGIRMVRQVNNEYLGSLHDVFPASRLGPTGDVAKVNCSTCHQGVYKPLFGVSMVADYPELATAAPTQ